LERCCSKIKYQNTYKILKIFLIMVLGNYDRIVEKIAKYSGLKIDEVNRKIEAKKAKLSGLISQDGAAQIVAAELGINFENEKLKIEELLPGMRKINISGKIITLFPVRTFKTQKGEEGKVLNFILADETSNIKVVLWDTNHIGLIEKGEIKEGDVVDVSNGSMRESEMHLGSFSEFKKSANEIADVKVERVVKEKRISDFKIGDQLSVRAFIVQAFQPRFFEVNKETGRKMTESEKEQGMPTEKRALINIVLDDGTETMRAVLFNENLATLGLRDLENPERLSFQMEALLGKEMFFSGNVRKNNFFNNEEFIVDSVREVNLDELIAKLEKN
jgi:ssDNA-binding replication factor A large subunit